jgi:U3 small nucleolar RNA-associated protein 19
MHGIVSDLSRSAKRKRESAPTKPSKRARSESVNNDQDDQSQILLFENEIFESKKNYNNIAKLVSILRDENEDPEKSVVAAISLCRVFARLMVGGDMNKTKETTEKEIVVIRWLKERYSEYKTALLALLGEEGVNTMALTLCMRLLKTEGQHLQNGQEYSFPTSFLTQIIQVLLDPDSDGSARKEFSHTYAEENDDIRFYTFESIE